ncbi:MAG: hypothetical protein KKD13_01505, partial [Candidatus Margulisbacteria bacterium]|nr:hypothetical protein [Candidatus Margulisiibacteriota bacterium]
MKKNQLLLILIAFLVFAAIIVVLLYTGKTEKEPAIQLARQPAVADKTISKEAETTGKLPKVLTLYQKGEGESDLAAFVSSELAKEGKQLATFRSINVTEDPQAAVYYGVTEHPTIIILRPNGSLFLKHEGYLE